MTQRPPSGSVTPTSLFRATIKISAANPWDISPTNCCTPNTSTEPKASLNEGGFKMHTETMILKHPWRVRIFHYLLIVSFLPLAVTGVILYFKALSDSEMNLVMQIHVAAGVVLSLDAAAFFLLAFDRVVLFVKRVFAFSMDDIRWFAVLGGYPQKLLMGKKIPVPPMGKYNSGQKLFGICVFIGG